MNVSKPFLEWFLFIFENKNCKIEQNPYLSMSCENRNEMEIDSKMVPNSKNGIGTRLEVVITKLGGIAHLAKTTDLSTSTLRRYINEETDVKLSDAVSLCRMAGISLMWLAEGVGPMRGESAHGVSLPGGLLSQEEAQKKLLNINATIETSYDKIQKNPSEFNGLRAHLEQIALQASLDDPTRAQADNLLYLVFEDVAAGQRREARFSKITLLMKERAALVQQAVDMSGVEVNTAILELVKTLVLPGEPDASDIARLLKAIAAQSQSK